MLKDLAAEYGIGEEDCSFAGIEVIRTLYASSQGGAEVLRRSIAEGKRQYALTRQLVLPPLIVDPSDVWAFELPSCEANFITQRKVAAPVIFTHFPRDRFPGGVLFIPSADPGYDWIFSHGIGGLVTMYGGVNSHMAIRAGELGIPAVIGAGEKLYKEWAGARLLEIDCLNRQVRVLK